MMIMNAKLQYTPVKLSTEISVILILRIPGASVNKE